MAFTEKQIRLTFKLGTGNFGESGESTLVIPKCKVQATILAPVGQGSGTAELNIHGVTMTHMAQLSALTRGGSLLVRKNTVVVEAGDMDGTLTTIFQGTIILGSINLNSSPDSILNVSAQTGGIQQVATVGPTSYKGTASVATIMQNLAALGGYSFENNGVVSVTRSPYYPGTVIDQINACREENNIVAFIDTSNNTLVIAPKGTARSILVPLISPDNGMVGYPTWASNTGGVHVKTLFNPNIRSQGMVVIENSQLAVANGQWLVYNLTHNLDSFTPDGQWFTEFDCQALGT